MDASKDKNIIRSESGIYGQLSYTPKWDTCSWKGREVGKSIGSSFKLSNFSQNFITSAKLSNFKRNFLTSLGSFQLRWVLSNFTRLGAFQLH